MTNSVKFPIRTKLFLMMSGFVLIATLVYLLLAIQVFKDDKVQLIYELNASTVKTMSAEVEASLVKVIDKIKLLTQGHEDHHWIKSVFESEPDLVAYTLFRFSMPKKGRGTSQWVSNTTMKNTDYLKLYGLDASQIDQIRKKIPIPFQQVIKKGIWIKNSTIEGGAPLLTIAIALDIQGEQSGQSGKEGRVPYIAVADMRLDKILKFVGSRKLATVYLIDSEGQVIAHPNMKFVTSRQPLEMIPIVKESLGSVVALQLKQFEWEGVRYLGAFSRVGVGGLTVISQIPEAQAFRASFQLVQKSVLFALIILTFSLLVTGWLSRSFTGPLSQLLAATEKLSRWEFGSSIYVKTQDEIASLARSFNAMASDLQNQKSQLDAQEAELKLKVKERTQALEEEKRKVLETQDALLRTTRLASLGELAGVAAHEVLNPMNNMNIRVERIHQQLQSSEKSDSELLSEIVTSWNSSYSKGWLSFEQEFMKPTGQPAKTLGQEDLINLAGIAQDISKRVEERAEDMKFLGREIIRVTRIVNNMRALSRVGGERRPLDIHTPIEEIFLTLGDLFKKRNIDFIKDFSASPRESFYILGDKDELVQVFSNLIRNAMQAVSVANRRAGTVRVSTKIDNSRVEVRIIDNGIGIDRQNLGKMFEVNFTTKSAEEGTGLGLSISRRLVRAFGGDIEIENTVEGKGTTFLIWFPKSS
jgi:signal transduction histidine kinase